MPPEERRQNAGATRGKRVGQPQANHSQQLKEKTFQPFEYLKRRSLDDREVIERFKIGFVERFTHVSL